jgi:hypothetical protein
MNWKSCTFGDGIDDGKEVGEIEMGFQTEGV